MEALSQSLAEMAQIPLYLWMYHLVPFHLVEFNVCGEFPCQNGGSCTPNGTMNYTCTCPPGVEGVNCEEDTYDGCVSNPCQNDGNCTVRLVTQTLKHCNRYTQQGV